MLRTILRRRTDGDRQAGAALVIVIGLTAVMLVAVGVALTGATSGLKQAVVTQSSARALDAAYAGVQDYIARLNADSTYPQYGASAAPFSSASTVKAPTVVNPAFGLGTAGTWASLPTVDNAASGATFRYEVDNSLYGSSGLLRLRATGRYGKSTKTLVASIQQQGFINYLYFTNFETQDPLLTGTSANCDRYLWGTPARSTSNCTTLQFGQTDTLEGPVRSNDTITICGSTFNGPVTTSNPGSPIVIKPSGCTKNPTYNASAPTYLPVLSMPDTNTAMKSQTYTDIATNPGCLYTGPTQIKLNTDGTMTVVSPWTEYTNTKSDATGGSLPQSCGKIKELHSTKGATVPVPSNNLVYVQSVPPSDTDVNYTPAAASTTTTSACDTSYRFSYTTQCVLITTGAACNTTAYQTKCQVVSTTPVANGGVPSKVTMGNSNWNSNTTYQCMGPGSGASAAALDSSTSSGSAGWVFTDGDGTIRYPLTNEAPATNWNSGNGTQWDTTTPAYGCRNGDVFVSGTLSGKLTIASDNYVYATNDIVYKDSTADVLGLVGNNGVLVWNPMTSSKTALLTAKDREIDAAILSPVHTFQVQNYDIGGNRGTLTVNGSIAQKYRGPVVTFNSNGSIANGYAKKYGYDARFVTVTPPYYLKPTSASFKVSSYASTKPAFSSTGATS